MAGQAHREGISLLELAEMFPSEDAAREWFEARIWPDGRRCPKCGSDDTTDANHRDCPYRCRACRAYFSVKAGTLMDSSKLPLRKWAFAIYLELTNLKRRLIAEAGPGHRDIPAVRVFMLHRIRAAFRSDDQEPPFEGPSSSTRPTWAARSGTSTRASGWGLRPSTHLILAFSSRRPSSANSPARSMSSPAASIRPGSSSSMPRAYFFAADFRLPHDCLSRLFIGRSRFVGGGPAWLFRVALRAPRNPSGSATVSTASGSPEFARIRSSPVNPASSSNDVSKLSAHSPAT